MYRIKTIEEFKLMKKDITQKLDNFIKDWDEFARYVSPKYWRSMSSNFNPRLMKDDIKRYEPATNKHLDSETFRDEVLTDEEKELCNNSNKYNL